MNIHGEEDCEWIFLSAYLYSGSIIKPNWPLDKQFAQNYSILTDIGQIAMKFSKHFSLHQED